MWKEGDLVKAVVKYALGSTGVAYRDMPEPAPGEGEIKVKVLAAGICGSDIHALHDSGGRTVNMPCILGHEFVGCVTETGSDTDDVKPGDWVTALPACYSCGVCVYCQKGLVTLCRSRQSIGTHRQGAMAEYVVVPAKYAFRLPERAETLEDKKTYALAEPFCCAVRGVYERIDVKPGDLAVVSGPGPMGIMAAMLFKQRGAYVIVSGLPQDQMRLDLAIRMGADEVVTSSEELMNAVYRKNTFGADITCDIAAVVPSLDTCLSVLRPNGVHLQIGLLGKPVQADLDKLFARETTFVSTNSTAVSSWKIGMELLGSGAVDLKPLMDLQCKLSDWRTGFDAVISKSSYKVVLIPEHDFDE